MEKKPGICKITFHKRAYLEEGDAFTVSLFLQIQIFHIQFEHEKQEE